MASKGRLIGALRHVEDREKRFESGSRKWAAVATAGAVTIPGTAVIGGMGVVLRELNHELDFRSFMRKWGAKLRNNPRAARFLAEHAQHKRIKKELEKIALQANTRARVRRRAGFPKNDANPRRTAQARVLRRAKGIGIQP